MSYLDVWDGAGRLMFSVDQSPYVFLKKVSVGPNAGTTISTTSSTSPPFLNTTTQQPIEWVEVGGLGLAEAPIVVITGDKCATAIASSANTLRFVGLKAGSCDLYLFGRHPGDRSSEATFECFDAAGKLIFDDIRRPLAILPPGYSNLASIDNLQPVPGGKKYGVLLADRGFFVSDLGNGRYRTYIFGGYTDAANAGVKSVNRDVMSGPTTGEPGQQVYKQWRFWLVDLTGM
jgi:hypothetical protein